MTDLEAFALPIKNVFTILTLVIGSMGLVQEILTASDVLAILLLVQPIRFSITGAPGGWRTGAGLMIKEAVQGIDKLPFWSVAVAVKL